MNDKLEFKKLAEKFKGKVPKCNCYRCTGQFYNQDWSPTLDKQLQEKQERQIRELAAGLTALENL